MHVPKETETLAHHPPIRKTGQESFTSQGQVLEAKLLDFWQWSASDLANNAIRGHLAEFIIASALGIASGLRTEWDAYDLITPGNLRIEIKSCAYLQSWRQTRPSAIKFSIREARAWDEATGTRQEDALRHSDLYIFALLAHKESKKTLDPLNLDQWLFYLVPTQIINKRHQSKITISLTSVESLCSTAVQYSELKQAVAEAESIMRGPKL